MNPVVRVENVSKRYMFQTYRPSLRHELGQMVSRLMGRSSQAAWEQVPFWSLRNISFTLNAGDTLGIIGSNGAGKTTLLRLLSGISEPTEGHIHINGRFAPLIGLGAGFDYERTGRENVFLNAAILGVPWAQINSALSQIVDFAELGDFLDRPVKIYSSGMIARLGFSIAYFFTPDIVFLDEIFSVGDIGFQSKSMEKILEFKERKTTVVFISHNLEAVKKLCSRTIWLDHGEIKMDAPTAQVVEAYGAAKVPGHGTSG